MITDLETEALVKCTALLRELSPESKLRVLKYLFERFNLGNTLQAETEIRTKDAKSNKALNGISIENYLEDGSKNKTLKNKVSKAISLKLVNTIDLAPPKEISLKSFVAKYESPKDFPERNLLIIYYLDKILKITDIGLNHIYTGYKHIGFKDPANLHQSLLDTKNKKGWIDISDKNNIKVTITGELHVEQGMSKTEHEIVNLFLSSIL